MNGGEGFPVGLVLFGMIAAFLVLRLRSILGKREGFERPAEPAAERAGAELRPARRPGRSAEPPPEPARALRSVPDAASPAGEAMARMQAMDATVVAGRFLDGAEQAFRIIVAAFASGDRAALAPLLGEETMRAFDAAITQREQAGESQRTELRAIRSVGIETAALHGSRASITARIVSDQVGVTTGRDGEVVAGTDAVQEITDLWTFERDLHMADPTWRLTAAQSG